MCRPDQFKMRWVCRLHLSFQNRWLVAASRGAVLCCRPCSHLAVMLVWRGLNQPAWASTSCAVPNDITMNFDGTAQALAKCGATALQNSMEQHGMPGMSQTASRDPESEFCCPPARTMPGCQGSPKMRAQGHSAEQPCPHPHPKLAH